jgi:hypothetical protein
VGYLLRAGFESFFRTHPEPPGKEPAPSSRRDWWVPTSAASGSTAVVRG